MPKHETWSILLNNLESKHSLAKKNYEYYKRNIFIKKFYEKCSLESISKPFLILKESSVKRNLRRCAH